MDLDPKNPKAAHPSNAQRPFEWPLAIIGEPGRAGRQFRDLDPDRTSGHYEASELYTRLDPYRSIPPDTSYAHPPVPAGIVLRWARSSSLWFLMFGISCCAIEMITAATPRYDTERFGIIYRATPRQADVLIVSGWVSKKLVGVLRTLYEQMAEPRYVIAMGSCACTGGIHRESPFILNGVDKMLPVDIYVPGCPPRPEELLDGIQRLQEKIKAGR